MQKAFAPTNVVIAPTCVASSIQHVARRPFTAGRVPAMLQKVNQVNLNRSTGAFMWLDHPDFVSGC